MTAVSKTTSKKTTLSPATAGLSSQVSKTSPSNQVTRDGSSVSSVTLSEKPVSTQTFQNNQSRPPQTSLKGRPVKMTMAVIPARFSASKMDAASTVSKQTGGGVNRSLFSGNLSGGFDFGGFGGGSGGTGVQGTIKNWLQGIMPEIKTDNEVTIPNSLKVFIGGIVAFIGYLVFFKKRKKK